MLFVLTQRPRELIKRNLSICLGECDVKTLDEWLGEQTLFKTFFGPECVMPTTGVRKVVLWDSSLILAVD